MRNPELTESSRVLLNSRHYPDKKAKQEALREAASKLGKGNKHKRVGRPGINRKCPFCPEVMSARKLSKHIYGCYVIHYGD